MIATCRTSSDRVIRSRFSWTLAASFRSTVHVVTRAECDDVSLGFTTTASTALMRERSALRRWPTRPCNSHRTETCPSESFVHLPGTRRKDHKTKVRNVFSRDGGGHFTTQHRRSM